MMDDLSAHFEQFRKKYLEPCAKEIEATIRRDLSDLKRIDRISTRTKGVNQYIAKAGKSNESGELRYVHPLVEIQDLIGVRIIVFFLSDIDIVKKRILSTFRSVEERNVEPESEKEFSYIGWHAICLIPEDCKPNEISGPQNKYFEIQIKTMFQHAWSEAEHDLGYKPMLGEISREKRRLISFAASLAWGADKAFEDIFKSVKSQE